MAERLRDKQSEIERLNQLLQHTQANLDHYRETIRQERVNEKQVFEEKIATLESQQHLQQAQTSTDREEIARLKQHIESLEKTIKIEEKAKIIIQENARRGDNDLQLCKYKLAQLQQMHDELLAENQTLTETADADKTSINELRIKTEKQGERIALQDICLQKAEGSLKSLADKHLFLTQEKTELAFQLKQALEVS